jgi:energy-coupling factor transport system permease protein
MSTPKLPSVGRANFFTRLDFRSKLAVFVAATALAVIWDNPVYTGGLMLAVLAACLAAGIPRSYLRLMVRVMTPFFILLLVTHGFFNKTYVLRLTGHSQLTPLLTFPPAWPVVGASSLSQEGLLYGFNVVCKSLTFLLLVPLCVFTTDPNNLAIGLVKLRLPYKLAFVVSSTLRFLPLVFGEIQAAIDTLRLRGHAPEAMGILERIRTYSKIAVPVTLSALFRAQQIEVALQSRAFSGKHDRTYLHESELAAPDWSVIVGAGLALAVAAPLYFARGLGRF